MCPALGKSLREGLDAEEQPWSELYRIDKGNRSEYRSQKKAWVLNNFEANLWWIISMSLGGTGAVVWIPKQRTGSPSVCCDYSHTSSLCSYTDLTSTLNTVYITWCLWIHTGTLFWVLRYSEQMKKLPIP